MRAGAAIADITPPVGIELSGGAFGPARGILHPLHARAVLFEAGDTRAILISCDLLGMDEPYCSDIRRDIAEAVGLPVEAVMIACTHTHGGPATVPLRGWGSPDQAYRSMLHRTLVDLAGSAAGKLTHATLTAAVGTLEDVSVNRSLGEAAGTCDHLSAMLLRGTAGEPVAAVVNYACHPVNLHSNGQVTPDFPHYVEQALRERLGAEVPVLFLNGASGDANPRNFVPREPSEQAAETTGRRIAERAWELLSNARPVEDAGVEFAAGTAELPLQPLPSAEQLRETIDVRGAKMQQEEPSGANWVYCGHKAAVEWAGEALELLEQGPPETTTAPLQALRVGAVEIVGIPGELFSRFGREIIENGPSPVTMVSTLTGGCMGYFPAPEAYEKRTYEAVDCPPFVGMQLFEPLVGERIAQASLKLLNSLPG